MTEGLTARVEALLTKLADMRVFLTGHQMVTGFDIDTLHEVEAALRDAQAHRGAEWAPIATAPKDGTPVWVGSHKGAHPYRDIATFGPQPDAGAWISVTTGKVLDMVRTPTHWMPLPPAPDEAPGSTETPDDRCQDCHRPLIDCPGQAQWVDVPDDGYMQKIVICEPCSVQRAIKDIQSAGSTESP
jgi:hypothetical protein